MSSDKENRNDAKNEDDPLSAEEERDVKRRLETAIREKLPSSENPEALATEIARLISVEVRHHQGPLPPPEMLAQYESVVPGLARDIVDRANREQRHRHDTLSYVQQTERRALTYSAAATYVGQFFALIISMTAIIGGIWLIAHDKSGEGLASIISALAFLAAAFIVGTIFNARESKDSEEESET